MLKELGAFKKKLNPKLYESEVIRKILLGESVQTADEDQIRTALKDCIFSHLSLDPSVLGNGSYLFYDIHVPRTSTNMKTCCITLYVLCHRDLIDIPVQTGHEGNRIDVLAQAAEEIILGKELIRTFGIGKMELQSVSVYNKEPNYYGKILKFTVPNFR